MEKTSFIDFLMPLAYTYKMADKSYRGSSKNLKMMERFGLLTIIVLGEGIIGIINGISNYHHHTVELMIAGLLQFAIVFGLWFIYFRTVEKREMKRGVWWRQVWTYLHFIMYTSMIMVGASMLYLIEHYHKIAGGKIYLVAFGVTMLAFACFEICLKRNDIYEGEKFDFYLVFASKFIGGIVSLVLGIINIKFNAMELLAFFIIVMAIVIFFMIRELVKDELYLKE